MTFLYSCRHDGDQYRITKLTDSLEVESSYLCTFDACECPAGEKRGRCRHMEMLPQFVARGAIGTGWMLDFDRGGWVDMRTEDELEPHSVAASTEDFDSSSAGSNPAGVATLTNITIDSKGSGWRRF